MANNYYPFGLSFNSYQRVTSKQNDYLYNGKELQDELDLNWLDYGARMYDPAIGRWHVQDRFAEKYLNTSPYNYTLNNPIKFIDINGDSTYLVMYGAGYLNTTMQGGAHDVGDGFKKSAETRAEEIRNREGYDPERDQVVLVEARSSEAFIDATNTEYESGKIASMDVFSHGYPGGVSLGGEDGNMEQVRDYDQREINSNNVDQINSENFESNAVVTFNGCNIGFGGANSFAQEFSNSTGTTVRAFNGSSEFTTRNGDGTTLTYEGRMIRSRDRRSQKSRYTIFKPGQRPQEPE